MARKTIGTLHTAITADARQYMNEFKRAQGATQAATAVITTALSRLGVGLSVGAVIAFGKSVTDLGGQIVDLSTAANMGSDQFQALALTAMQSGLDFEQTAKAAENMRSKIQDAAAGNEAAVASFKTLGLTAAGLKALAPERQWEVIAAAIVNAKDKQAAMNAASDIFGAKIAPKLRETLNTLAVGGFDKLNAATKGLQFSKEQLATLDQAGDKMALLWHYTKLLGAKAITATGVDTSAKGIMAELEKKIASYEAHGAGDSQNARDYKRSLAAMNEKNAAMDKIAASTAAAEAELKLYTDAENDAMMQNAEQLAAAERARAADAVSRKAAIERAARDELVIQSAIAKTSDEVRDLTDKQREAVQVQIDANDPLFTYKETLKQLNLLMEATPDKADALRESIGRVTADMRKAQIALSDAAAEELYGIDPADWEKNGKKTTDEFSATMEQMWNRVADNASEAMADILLDGTNTFEELGRVIVRTMMAAAIKAQIIMPLMNAVGGATGLFPGLFGAAFGKPAADGGYRDGSKPYLVGENGPEMFTPSGAGTITPTNRLNLGNTDAGANITQTFNFASGVTRSELAALIPSIVKASKQAVAESYQRGGGYRRALA